MQASDDDAPEVTAFRALCASLTMQRDSALDALPAKPEAAEEK